MRSPSSSSPIPSLTSHPSALITISHRPSLFKYHQHLLRLTGHDGAWESSQIGTAAEHLSFQREIDTLEEKLRDVDSWKERLAAIDKELAFTTS